MALNLCNFELFNSLTSPNGIYYIDPNKKRTNNWLVANRLQLPLHITKYGSINKITYPDTKVNTFSENNSEPNITQALSKSEPKTERDITKVPDKGGKRSVKNNFNITSDDVKAVQAIGERKSVNQFDSNEIKATEKFARKYFEEMGVKSPFFRAWFGDWREFDNSPIHIVTEKRNDRGIVKNNDTGWDIQISGKVFAETNHQAKKNQSALVYLDYVNSLVKNAVLLDSCTIPKEKAKSENSAVMHSLYAIADIGNGKELLKLYVEELNDVNSNGTINRAYQLQNITNQQLESSEFGKKPSSIIQTADKYSVSDLFDLVKTFDKDFKPNPTSLILNDDGTPKVVYHGSTEDFKVFDITKSRSWYGTPDYDLPGFYFSENLDESFSYGNTKPYYINISKPYTGDIYKLAKEKGSYRNAYEYLVDEGYDGVIVDDMGEGYDEYIVLRAENIKSATDNIGTFDRNNPDIRYSIKENPTEAKTNLIFWQTSHHYECLSGIIFAK